MIGKRPKVLWHQAKRFLPWWGQVLKKVWWMLGLPPALLDVIHTWIPPHLRPAFLSGLIEWGISWEWSLILVPIGLLISAFLVHSQTQDRLEAYEYQAPEYELPIEEITSKACPIGLHVECTFRIESLNCWFGSLAEITVQRDAQIVGLGNWSVDSVYRHIDSAWLPLPGYPLAIAQAGCELQITMHSKIIGEVDREDREHWKEVLIPVQLRIKYFTQPVGDVQRLFPLDVRVSLEQALDDIMSSDRAEGT